MNIPIIGPLHPHPKIPEWLASRPIAIPYFDKRELVFILDGLSESDESDASTAIAAFLKLGPNDRLKAVHHVFLNYRKMADLVDEDDLGCQIHSEAEVWKHIRPTEIYVKRRRRKDQLIYVLITAECDWEREHGLQIVYRRGNELSRVSDQDGHLTRADAYNLPEDQDRICE